MSASWLSVSPISHLSTATSMSESTTSAACVWFSSAPQLILNLRADTVSPNISGSSLIVKIYAVRKFPERGSFISIVNAESRQGTYMSSFLRSVSIHLPSSERLALMSLLLRQPWASHRFLWCVQTQPSPQRKNARSPSLHFPGWLSTKALPHSDSLSFSYLERGF